MGFNLKTCLLCILLIMTGCTTTTIQLKEKSSGQPIKSGIDFDITAEEGPSSIFTKHFPRGFCGLNLDASVKSVNTEGEWDSYSIISFSNSGDTKQFDILFYYDRVTAKLTPLIMHSGDESAEPLGVKFDLKEDITVILYRDQFDFGISLEPASKIKNILSVIESAENNKGLKFSENFNFSIVELDFVPTKVSFLGVSSDSKFENIMFRNDC